MNAPRSLRRDDLGAAWLPQTSILGTIVKLRTRTDRPQTMEQKVQSVLEKA